MASFVLIGLALTVVMLILVGRVRSTNKRYSSAAETLHLKFEKGFLLGAPSLSGYLGGFKVEVKHTYRSRYSAPHDTYSIHFPRTTGFRFSIRRERMIHKIGRLLGNQDLVIGDDTFDKGILLESTDPSKLVALLNEKTRQILLRLAYSAYKNDFQIAHHTITVKLTDQPLPVTIRQLIDLAKALTPATPWKTLLLNNFHTEKLAGVRLRNFEMLIRIPENHEDLNLINQGLQHRDPHINFQVIKYVKDKQYPVHLEPVWKKSDHRLQQEILEFLAGLKKETFVDFLTSQFRTCKTDIRADIVETLEKIGSEMASDFLSSLLQHDDQQVVRAAVKALGPCGKVTAVEPLFRINHPLLKAAAKKSILQIQSRLKEGDKGWLSLSHDSSAAGSLGLAVEDRGGELSLEPDEDSPGEM